MDPRDALELLPRYPQKLSPIEWVAIAAVAVLLLSYLIDRVWLSPRREKAAEERRAAEEDAAREEREKERSASRVDRREDTTEFLASLQTQRVQAVASLDRIAAAHEAAFSRIHSRLDDISREVSSVRRAVSRLECYPRGDPTVEAPRAARPGG